MNKNNFNNIPTWLRVLLLILIILAFVKFYILKPTGRQREDFPSHTPGR
jgi:hypothetical protein